VGVVSEPVLAAWRDASWHNSPGVARRYHVLVDGMAACNSRSMLLNDDNARPAEEIQAGLRCQRPGCRRLWPPVSSPRR
jgi:hypothetical protein